MIGHPETNPITIKPKTASHTAEQFSWVPLPYCSPPGCPFPKKSLCQHMCLLGQFIPSVRQEPSFGLWKGSPFLQQFCCHSYKVALYYLVKFTYNFLLLDCRSEFKYKAVLVFFFLLLFLMFAWRGFLFLWGFFQ